MVSSLVSFAGAALSLQRLLVPPGKRRAEAANAGGDDALNTAKLFKETGSSCREMPLNSKDKIAELVMRQSRIAEETALSGMVLQEQ